MRFKTAAALLLLPALVTACGQAAADDPQVASAGKGKASASASPSASHSADPDAPLKFARCMREHGITWFPDPGNGKQSIAIPQGTDAKKFEAAQEACKQFMPDGGQVHKPSAEDLQAMRDQAKCMRDNGVPNFPDPQPDGGLMIDPRKLGTGPGDPTFDKAQKTCEKYMPKGAEKHTENHSNSGGGGVTNMGGGA
ncbi:hypothetical protein ACQP2F_06870 [Actinoplanes sp. CA-030573]|uniref:hypothetical protein n=1 Tax=Actinoplanes sp. CA-030573 TaxID=3239898 RepID=UPI003D8D5459